jgi:single-strand DNA-binding protein
MSSVNKVTLLGTLGRDPEIKSFQSGDQIAELSIATSERWNDKATGEKKEKTEWHKVVIRNDNLVRVAENYLAKGAKVYLEGSLQTREWADKDGSKRYSTEIVIGKFKGELVLISEGKEREARQESQKASKRGFADDLEDDSEIPF